MPQRRDSTPCQFHIPTPWPPLGICHIAGALDAPITPQPHMALCIYRVGSRPSDHPQANHIISATTRAMLPYDNHDLIRFPPMWMQASSNYPSPCCSQRSLKALTRKWKTMQIAWACIENNFVIKMCSSFAYDADNQIINACTERTKATNEVTHR